MTKMALKRERGGRLRAAEERGTQGPCTEQGGWSFRSTPRPPAWGMLAAPGRRQPREAVGRAGSHAHIVFCSLSLCVGVSLSPPCLCHPPP